MNLLMNFKKGALIGASMLILLLVSLTGCKSSLELTLDNMNEPVYIAAIGESGDVLLRDSIGNVLLLNNNYYMAQAIVGGNLKVGDMLIPESTGN